MEFLKEILGEDLYKQVETAINTHNSKEENKEKQVKIGDLSSGAYTSTDKFTSLQNEKNNVDQQLAQAQTLINELKAGTKKDEGLQDKISGYETQIQKLTDELAQTKLENAVSAALRDAKGVDIDYLAYKLKNMDGKLELDDNGKIKGIEDKITVLKTQFPTQFEAAGNPKKVDPQPLPKDDGTKEGQAQSLNDAIEAYYNQK